MLRRTCRRKCSVKKCLFEKSFVGAHCAKPKLKLHEVVVFSKKYLIYNVTWATAELQCGQELETL
jgi:hypothetical protein